MYNDPMKNIMFNLPLFFSNIIFNTVTDSPKWCVWMGRKINNKLFTSSIQTHSIAKYYRDEIVWKRVRNMDAICLLCFYISSCKSFSIDTNPVSTSRVSTLNVYKSLTIGSIFEIIKRMYNTHWNSITGNSLYLSTSEYKKIKLGVGLFIK